MHYPKPQKGNPHKLTIDQHIFPKPCISRSYGLLPLSPTIALVKGRTDGQSGFEQVADINECARDGAFPI